MKAHRFAELFPMMDKEQLKELAKDIKINGQQEDIVTVTEHGVEYILDGRNRWAACVMAGVEPERVEYQGDLDALSYVISKNIERRHLSTKERAIIVAKAAAMTSGQPKKSIASNDAIPSQTALAKKLKVSRSSVTRAKREIAPPKPAKKPKAAKSWSPEDLKGDGELMNAFKNIDIIYGHEGTKAIRTGIVGLSRADIILLSKLTPDKMRDMRGLIIGKHWTPKRAMQLLNKMPVPKSTLEEMHNWCIGTEDKNFVVQIGNFRHICEMIDKNKH